jgi:hypothetical protein
MPSLNRIETRKRLRFSLLAASALVSLAFAMPAQAEPATPEGARKLTEAFQAYIGPEPFQKGFLSIAPHGESYDVTVAFDSSKLDLPDQDGTTRLDPYVVHLTPKPDGTWGVSTDPGPIGMSWTAADTPLGEAPKNQKVNLKLADCVTQGVFDPKLLLFPALSSKCGSGTFAVRASDGDLDIATGELSTQSTGKADGGSADLQFDLQVAKLSGKFTEKKPDSPPFPVAFQLGSFRQTFTTNGARIGAVADLVAFLKDNASRDRLVLVQSELKAKLRAALPFWQDISSVTRLDDGVVDTPAGSAKIAHIEQHQALTGVVKDARYADGLSYSGLELPPLLVPEWARTLVPTQASYNTKLSFSGLDGMADVLIRGLDASQDPPFTKLMAVALMTRFFSGQPQYELNLDTTAQAYAIKGQGSASINPEPKAGISLSATGFDAIVAALSKANQPDIQKALFGLAFVKGLARAGTDGQLVWDVSYDIVTNKLVVNDQSFALPEPQ